MYVLVLYTKRQHRLFLVCVTDILLFKHNRMIAGIHVKAGQFCPKQHNNIIIQTTGHMYITSTMGKGFNKNAIFNVPGFKKCLIKQYTSLGISIYLSLILSYYNNLSVQI